MQSRFKFRAWNVCKNKYFTDDEICIDTGGVSNSAYDLIKRGHPFYSVEQCTGLKDKHGKLVYEGDILSISPDPQPRDCYKVFWQDNECQFQALAYDGSNTYVRVLNELLEKDDMEIIGNIHENPELLEDKQE